MHIKSKHTTDMEGKSTSTHVCVTKRIEVDCGASNGMGPRDGRNKCVVKLKFTWEQAVDRIVKTVGSGPGDMNRFFWQYASNIQCEDKRKSIKGYLDVYVDAETDGIESTVNEHLMVYRIKEEELSSVLSDDIPEMVMSAARTWGYRNGVPMNNEITEFARLGSKVAKRHLGDAYECTEVYGMDTFFLLSEDSSFHPESAGSDGESVWFDGCDERFGSAIFKIENHKGTTVIYKYSFPDENF